MSRLRGLREKIVRVYNPLPKGHTERSLAQEQGFKYFKDIPNTDAFSIQWTYGQGLLSEMLLFAPQGYHDMRDSEAKELKREFRDRGLVVLEQLGDSGAMLEASIAGVEVELGFWQERGQVCLDKIQSIQSYTDEQMRQHKNEHWIYYVNAKRVEKLEAWLTYLRGQLEAAAA